MNHINILVEGQSEEGFVKQRLYPYLIDYNISITPIIISTKKIRAGGKFKGGLNDSNFDSFIKELKQLLTSTPHGYVSTFIDYYHLPQKFPGYEDRKKLGTPIDKVEFLEAQLFDYFNQPKNFIPYIQLHEFETFHFVDSSGFSSTLPNRISNELLKIINQYDNPEEINEGEDTAPSKRIIKHYPAYNKLVDGDSIIEQIGIDKLINKCPHFRKFIQKIMGIINKQQLTLSLYLFIKLYLVI